MGQAAGEDPPRAQEEAPLPFATEESLFDAHRRAAEEVGPRRDVLTFRLGPEEYGAEVEGLVEVCRVPVLTEIPRSPACCLGFFSLRGTVVPVIDLRARLGLPFDARAGGARSGRERVVIAKVSSQGEAKIGMLVDELVEVAKIPVAMIQPAPAALAGVDREIVKGVALLDREPGRRARGAAPSCETEAGSGSTSEAPDRRLVILLELEKVLSPGDLQVGP